MNLVIRFPISQHGIPAGRVDQKRIDAISMLDEMEVFLSSSSDPMQVDYHFEWTHFWDELTSDAPNNSDIDAGI